MVRCPRCSAEIQPTWDWCHACGFDPSGHRPDDWTPAGVPVAAGRAPALADPPSGPTAPKGRRRRADAAPAPVASMRPDDLPVSGQYTPPPYNPPVADKRKGKSGPSPRDGRPPIHIPVGVLVAVVAIIAALGAGAYVVGTNSAKHDAGALVAADTGDWRPWTAPDGRYTVTLPVVPVFESAPVERAPGETATTNRAMADAGTSAYSVAVTDLSPTWRAEHTDDELLTQAIAELQAAVPGVPLEVTAFEVWAGLVSVGFEGTMTGADQQPRTLSGRVAVSAGHVYVLVVRERTAPADAAHFLGSFQPVI